eukprot:TRINITY_DN2707_c0_g2_i1.p1 TRINITY_DN2707_c0_g2~~TRINITY_DN2707_c0_g2_i1.p1  ORF type:complete len:236 (+),score=76.85 TRINITY_DN2707_c0_g2_i1:260-967(+)
MGHSYSQISDQFIPEEFDRCRALYRKERDYLVLDQVLQIQNTNWESFAVDFTHIGTLWVLDRRKNGKFYLEDFKEFAALCKMIDDLYRKSDFISKFKAYCTLVLWSSVAKDLGIQKFVRWFTTVLANNTFNEEASVRFPKYSGVFLSYDTVKTMHQILNIRESYGIPFQDFFAMCLKATREKDKSIVGDESEEMEEYVLIEVLSDFAKHFATGFVNLMLELGFDPDMDPDTYYEG